MGIFFCTFGATWPEQSLYRLPMKWKGDQGESVQLSQWAGQYVFITMTYTTCTSACPLILKKMKSIQSDLDNKKLKAQVVTVTYDPESDTWQKLAHFKKAADFDFPNWHFLSGSEKDTRQLSMLLGINYRKNPVSKHIEHSNKIILLSPQGIVLGSIEGLGQAHEELINLLLKDSPR